MALVNWVEISVKPPPSVFPSRAKNTLVEFQVAQRSFPSIPGIEFPRVYNQIRLKNHSIEPPIEGDPYPVYLAATDSDGNCQGGIRDPLLVAPIATLTGWMLRSSGYAEGELYSINGSLFPFMETAEERRVMGDPRPSLLERYVSQETWRGAIYRAAALLVSQRLLLAEDAEKLTAAAALGWNVENFS